MEPAYRLSTEFFAIPYRGETYLLYSPLKQILMLVNQDMVDLVAALRDGTFGGVNGENMDAVQLLIDAKAVNGPEDEPPRHRMPPHWKPTEVTLFLTNACNLRCSYCYASAGEFHGILDPQTACRAVELVAQNALARGEGEFRVSYHGGGEPTLAWEGLTASAECAEALAAKHTMKARLSLATNGVLPAWKVDWLVRHVEDYSISFDGPAWVQDRYRRTVSGGGSAQAVEATLRHLDSHRARYGVRVTVTDESVAHLAETVGYLLNRYSPATVHVEPVFIHGRARSNGVGAPDPHAFVDNFRAAQAVAEQFGLDLYYSGARTETITDTFCGVPDASFNVTPEGLLTACFEVCHPQDDHADQFFYGSLDRETGEFAVSRPRLRLLAQRTVRERPECQRCFCKWHCAGDCIAKNLASDREPDRSLKAARCIINQELSRDQLLRRLRQHSRVMRQVEATGPSESPPRLAPAFSSTPAARSPVQPAHAGNRFVILGN